ncbi:hypothetical protein [Sporomusa aerivorans]|uniref:hypothetical protein n=1 Tax=Sporomusa aerivorans TaxID=204936 RepID=UPI00352A6375
MAENKYTHSVLIYDADNKKHKVYPVPLLYIQEVAQFLSKINPDFLFSNFMIAETDEYGTLERAEDGKLIYGITFTEELLEIVEIALRFKESKEDIRKWLDIGVTQEIVQVLIGLSQVKKKTEQTESQNGTA